MSNHEQRRDQIELLAMELQAQARVVAQLVLHKDWDRAAQQALIYDQIQSELHALLQTSSATTVT